MVDAPKLKDPTFQRRGTGDASELRTVTKTEPRKPVSAWHRAYWWLHHHLTRNRLGEWKGDPAGWGAHRSTVPRASTKSYRERERANDRETAAAAAHAQQLREEAATMGAGKGSRERADFYGGRHGSHNDRAEQRTRGIGAARERHESQLRAEAKPRKGIRW